MIKIEQYKDFQVIKYNNYYLSSKYNPQKEAERIYQHNKSKSNIIILGIGSGYFLNLLLKNNHFNKIIVIENNIHLLNAVKTIHNINFNNFNNLFVLNNQLESFKNEFKTIISFTDILSFEIIKNSIQVKTIDSNYYSAIENKIYAAINEIKTDFWTKLYLSKSWNTNSLINLKHFNQSRSINNLIKKFNNSPGILIGAGPSLNKNIDLLNKFKDNFISVAVDTALRTCLTNNYTPDFVFSLDCNKANYNDYIGIDTTNLRLIYDIVTYPQILDEFKGKKYVSVTGHYYEDRIEYIEFYYWFKKFIKPEIRYIQTGGSVSHSAFDFLRILGCNPIIIVGQDLAYTGYKTHSTEYYYNFKPNKFNTYESHFFHSLKTKSYYFVKGWYNDTVLTDSILTGYKKWFEDAGRILNKSLTLINSTEGGVNIDLFDNIPLNIALSKYCKNKITKNYEQYTSKLSVDNENLVSDIHNRIKNFKNCIILAQTGLEYLQKVYQNTIECNYTALKKYKTLILNTEEYFIKTFLKDYRYNTLVLNNSGTINNNELIKSGIYFKIMKEAAEYFLPYFKNLLLSHDLMQSNKPE